MWPVQEAVHSVSEPTSRYTGSQHGLLQLQIVSIGLTCGTGLFNKFHSSRNHCSPRESRLSLFLSSRPTLLDTATFTRSLDNIFGYVAITKVLINLKGNAFTIHTSYISLECYRDALQLLDETKPIITTEDPLNIVALLTAAADRGSKIERDPHPSIVAFHHPRRHLSKRWILIASHVRKIINSMLEPTTLTCATLRVDDHSLDQNSSERCA